MSKIGSIGGLGNVIFTAGIGVTIYEDANFGGRSVPLDEGHTRFTTDFNDAASFDSCGARLLCDSVRARERVLRLRSFGRSPRRLPRSFGVRLRQEDVVRERLSNRARWLRVGSRCDA